ncbi:MAG: flavodoxin [Pseudomonadota bacterium]
MRIGIVFGSTTGNTEEAAEAIFDELETHVQDVLSVERLALDELTGFDVLLVGIPTWDIGELQEDWARALGQFDDVNFAGTQVAFFGDGDQFGYPDNFQDAMGILRDRFLARGASADIGHWPTENYNFTESKGVVNGKFVGLALDELHQPDLTGERIATWAEQLVSELRL